MQKIFIFVFRISVNTEAYRFDFPAWK